MSQLMKSNKFPKSEVMMTYFSKRACPAIPRGGTPITQKDILKQIPSFYTHGCPA